MRSRGRPRLIYQPGCARAARPGAPDSPAAAASAPGWRGRRRLAATRSGSSGFEVGRRTARVFRASIRRGRDSSVLLGAPAGGKCRPSLTGTHPRERRPGPGQRSCRAPARAPWRGPSTPGCWVRDGVNGVKYMQPTANPEEPPLPPLLERRPPPRVVATMAQHQRLSLRQRQLHSVLQQLAAGWPQRRLDEILPQRWTAESSLNRVA